MELPESGEPRLVSPELLGNMTSAVPPAMLPAATELPEADGWLHEQVLRPFLEETRAERIAEVQRISDHVELSLTELLAQADVEIGRATEAKEQGITGAEGRLVRAENRHDVLRARRQRRGDELKRQASVTLQT